LDAAFCTILDLILVDYRRAMVEIALWLHQLGAFLMFKAG
jgi:hypothetical protein